MTTKGKSPHKHPFTDDGVLAYITENQGIRYQSSQIGRNFRVPAKEMTVVLRRLAGAGKITTSVMGATRCYYIMSDAELTRQQAARQCEFKSLKGYDTMMRNIADGAVKGRS